jgi:hypothetical protein
LHNLKGVLCDKDPDSADHLFVSCSFSKQVWHTILSTLNIALPVDAGGLLEWWLLLRKGHNKLKQKGTRFRCDASDVGSLEGTEQADLRQCTGEKTK